MFLMCPSCHEPRDIHDKNCGKCGTLLPALNPCLDCKGKGFLDSGDGPEDCPRCDGIGAI